MHPLVQTGVIGGDPLDEHVAGHGVLDDDRRDQHGQQQVQGCMVGRVGLEPTADGL
ncbi:hypothetical protein [Streptomyces sp. NBC_01538]|uniref:hypothetical protein n=1 Tax=Streptomyces sp. NBC_01538 TaxID=2903897 RepID=UPI00386C9D72